MRSMQSNNEIMKHTVKSIQANEHSRLKLYMLRLRFEVAK